MLLSLWVLWDHPAPECPIASTLSHGICHLECHYPYVYLFSSVGDAVHKEEGGTTFVLFTVVASVSRMVLRSCLLNEKNNVKKTEFWLKSQVFIRKCHLASLAYSFYFLRMLQTATYLWKWFAFGGTHWQYIFCPSDLTLMGLQLVCLV